MQLLDSLLQYSSMLRTFRSWFDSHALLFASLFLLVFIPLYPKIPLFDVIPGYLVRARLEDLLVAATGLLWLVQSWRGKIVWRSSFLWLVLSYAVVGFLSILSAVLLLQTIPASPLHLGKSFLHYFRYAEYFSVFFFAYAGFTQIKHVKYALWLLTASVVAITIYGYGQIYWQWPLYSTMNREFSKGTKLYLSEFARVQSTFAGHYDLAAYLVLVLPILFSAALLRKNTYERIVYVAAHIGGLWLLIASGSNIALAAYAIGVAVVAILFLRRFTRVFRYSLIASGVIASGVVVICLVLFFTMPEIPKRLIQQAEQSSVLAKIPGLPLALRTVRVTAYPETAPKPSQENKPADVHQDLPDRVEVATVSATGTVSTIIVERDRTWSENAIKYGLSMGIRFDTLWPQALKGWTRNLYLGSGYGTLTKEDSREFADSDSTDNNYLRALGETGLLGFTFFFAMLGKLLKRIWASTTNKNDIVAIISIGSLGAIAGLLTNAVIIDVFVASKVAFTFWALAGIAAKTIQIHSKQMSVAETKKSFSVIQFARRHVPLLLGLLLTVVLLHKNPLDEQSSTRDLAQAPESVEMLATLQCWHEQQSWSLCADSVQLPSNSSKLYGALLYPLYDLTHIPALFYYTNLVLALLSVALIYSSTRKVSNSPLLQFFAMVFMMLVVLLQGTVALPVASNLWLPLFLIILRVCLEYKPLQQSLQKAVSVTNANSQLSYTALFGTATLLALFFSFGRGAETLKLQLQEYRGNLPALRSQTVRRANQFFEAQRRIEQQESSGKTPYLITTLDPLFINLYSNGLYAPLPLSKNQTYYDQFALTTGLESSTDLHTLYRSIIADQPLYFIDTDAKAQYSEEYDRLRAEFTVWQLDTDCEEQCDVYSVSTDVPGIPTQPVSLSGAQLVEDASASHSFITYNHRFNFSDPLLTHTIVQFDQMLQPVKQLGADFIFANGDITAGNDVDQRAYFQSQIAAQTSVPLLHVPGNYDEVATKPFPTSYQQFRKGSSLYITIMPSVSGEISRQQQLFLYNILHQLEKQSDIKEVFFISHRMGWIAGNPDLEPLAVALNQPLTADDLFYTEKLIPKLQNLPEKQFYFIAGDLKPNPITNVFYHQDGNLTYAASAVNNHINDAYMLISVSEDSSVSITPISGANQPLLSIESYGLDHWRTVAPSLGTFQEPEPPNESVALLKKIAVSLVFGAAATLLYSLLKTDQRKERK